MNIPASLLIVDDSVENLSLLGELLKDNYQVQVATSGIRALELTAGSSPPDLILLDVMMPGLNGFQTLERLRSNPVTRAIPVIFITAMDELSAERHGLEIGAVDFITKPIDPTIVRARVRTHIELKQTRDRLADHNMNLEAEISRRIAENELTQRVSIRALAHLAETRDPETGNHILRTQNYVQCLARKLQQHPRFSSFLTERTIELLARSAPLHDIGKVGVPDNILLKPGPLSELEWHQMKHHARLGAMAIEQAETDVHEPIPFLTLAKEIAQWHHEKWDGSGYPDGLCHDEIPISARLMALADVFDALISSRVYKPAFSYDKAREIILAGRGKHFDPDITDAFIKNFDEFVGIAEQYRDSEMVH